MAFRDTYTEVNKAGRFQNIGWGQNFDNTSIDEQPDVLEHEEPSVYTSQSSSGPYFLKPPVDSDLIQYNIGHPQPGAVDNLWNSFHTFEGPAAPPANPIYSSPPRSPPSTLSSPLSSPPSSPPRSPPSSPPSSSLTRLNISNPLSPPYSFLPTEKTTRIHELFTAGTERSVQGNKATKIHSYGYKPLDIAPASWDIFSYNRFGELEPGRTYSALEIMRYLYTNPKHHVGDTYSPKLGGLTLWIQRTPPDSSLAHGHPEAGLCRFEDCEHNNVIKAGDVRVAFDELTKRIQNLNPQHNAGYVHLSCIEKKMNFPMLCKDLDIKPEDRVLPLEPAHRNEMMMQDRSELEHVHRFITFCDEHNRAPRSYPRLGTLHDEILKFERGKLKSKLEKGAVEQWQTRGVEWDDQDKARKQRAKKLYLTNRIRKRMAKKKRVRKAEDSESGQLEEERPREKVRARVIARHAGARTRRAPPHIPRRESDADSSSSYTTDSETIEAPRRNRLRRNLVPKVPQTPKPESDSDSSSITELDRESEEDEAPCRKRTARHAPAPTRTRR